MFSESRRVSAVVRLSTDSSVRKPQLYCACDCSLLHCSNLRRSDEVFFRNVEKWQRFLTPTVVVGIPVCGSCAGKLKGRFAGRVAIFLSMRVQSNDWLNSTLVSGFFNATIVISMLKYHVSHATAVKGQAERSHTTFSLNSRTPLVRSHANTACVLSWSNRNLTAVEGGKNDMDII